MARYVFSASFWGKSTAFALLLFATHGLVGCGTTTEFTRDRAKLANERMKAYVEDQQNRVARLNQEFTDTQAELLKTHRQEIDRWIEHGQTLDHQRLADQLISDWKAETLPGKMRDTLHASMERQVQRLYDQEAKSEEALAFVKSIQELKAPLKKLKTIQATLEHLSTPQATNWRAIGSFLEDSEYYQRLLKKIKTEVKI